jgi:hypothetical protein
MYKIAKNVSWSPALCHIKGLMFRVDDIGLMDKGSDLRFWGLVLGC